MHTLIRRVALAMTTVCATLLPGAVMAQETAAQAGKSAFMVIGMLLLFLVLSVLLTKVWVGIVNVQFLDVEPLSSIEQRHPYLPSLKVMLVTIVGTAILLGLTIRTFGTLAPFEGPEGMRRGVLFATAACAIAGMGLVRWKHAKEYVFAVVLGTILSFVLIGFEGVLLDSSQSPDPFFSALGVVGIALAWRFLFGPWIAHIKATVLGTFIFWVVFHLLWQETEIERMAHLLAIGVALIPAVIWCALFLRYHWERMSLVMLMFFSGMLSTVPILFYDAMVRRGIELQFLLFRIVPENFTRASNALVTGAIVEPSAMRATLLSSLLAFLLVGVIEEASKFWVLKKSGTTFFRSINDVVELGIIVAIGFAFAENVINPTYFVSFVREYLLAPSSADWGSFIGNVIGRSILTTMVHIVATGVLGYFLGLAIFAGPILEEARRRGKTSLIPGIAWAFLRIPEKAVFRRQMVITGFLIAVVLHGLFNFMVSLPDLLPGNPRTLGELFGLDSGSYLHLVSLILIPSLFYVLGGFWILSTLLFRNENNKVHGQLVITDTFLRVG